MSEVENGNEENISELNIIEMLEVLENWEQVNHVRFKTINRDMRSRIECLNHSNKILKDAIKNYKKIMSFE